jgi:hypothetical protein
MNREKMNSKVVSEFLVKKLTRRVQCMARQPVNYKCRCGLFLMGLSLKFHLIVQGHFLCFAGNPQEEGAERRSPRS